MKCQYLDTWFNEKIDHTQAMIIIFKHKRSIKQD